MIQIYTIEEIRKIANKIAKRHGVKRMFLFGSYARGDAKSGSDLDFRIDKGKIRGLFALGGLYADLEEAFGLPIDLLTSESLNEEFIKEISDEEVLIYEQEQ
jgi:predicted nucleotidyltransferase